MNEASSLLDIDQTGPGHTVILTICPGPVSGETIANLTILAVKNVLLFCGG